LVNNVGFLKAGLSDMEQPPQALKQQLQLNLYPITLMSKYAKLSFLQQARADHLKEADKRFAMIHLSSMSGIRFVALQAGYSASKHYDRVFG
jgi:short-subunit dehydrogenase